jgi:hypothetical protein
MKGRKVFTIECVNKIKYEKAEEFGKSIFCDVYEKAVGLVSKILDDNRIIENDKTTVFDKSFYNGERLNNVVSFVGKRGMGKSSAMLSLAGYLANYSEDSKGNGISGELKLKCNSDNSAPYFLALPRIDVAMLTTGENLLDIILANMWTTFYDETEKLVGFDYVADESKKKFSKVKKSYKKYNESVKGIVDDNSSSLGELKELSKCVNLMNDFRELVDTYLKYMMERKKINVREGYLLVVLDDLDVATRNTYDVLEQIRMFLMIPKVVVLVSMDVGRLIFECNKFFESKIWCADDGLKNEQVTKYSQRYITKIFPDNMRIYMPNLNSEEIYLKSTYKKHMKFLAEGRETNTRHIFYGFIQYYTGICMYPFGRMNYGIRKSSLRDIVNNLHILDEMNDKKDNIDMALAWLESNLEELKNGTTNHACHKFMQELLEIDDEYMGEVVIDSALTLLKKYSTPNYKAQPRMENERDEYSYLLKCIHDLSEVGESGVAEMTDFLSLLYSKHMVKSLRHYKDVGEDRDLFVEIFGRHIFSNITTRKLSNNRMSLDPLEDETNESRDDDLKIANRIFNIDIISQGKDEYTLFENNVDNIYNVVCLAIVSSVNLWNCEALGYCSYSRQEKSKELSIGYRGYQELSLDSIIYNIVNYERLLRGVCINILACYKGVEVTREFVDTNEKVISKIMEIEKFHLKEYKKLKGDYQIKSMLDVLPLSSVELMCEIAKEIERFPQTVSGTPIEKLKRQYDMLISQLERIEAFYNVGKDKRIKYTSFLKDIENELEFLDTSILHYNTINDSYTNTKK